MISGSLGAAHFTAAVAALALGFVVLIARKGTDVHRLFGLGFVIAMIVLNATAMGDGPTGPTVETRQGGIQKILVDFNRSVTLVNTALGMAIDQCGAAGELPGFGEKLTGYLIDHRCHVTEPIALGNRDTTGQDDEHSRSGFAGLEQFLAVLVASQFAEAAHARDLVRGQRRKCLLMPRKRGRQRSAAIGFIFSRPAHVDLRLTSLDASETWPAPNPAICPVFFRRRHVVRPHQDCEVPS